MDQIFTFLLHHWELSLALVAILGALAALELRTTVNGVKQLTPPAATQLINREDAFVLDLREPNKFMDGHILSATSIPRAQLANQLDKLKSHQTKPIILVADLDQAANQAGVLLQKNGFTQVYNLRGGINAWRNANLPLAKKGK